MQSNIIMQSFRLVELINRCNSLRVFKQIQTHIITNSLHNNNSQHINKAIITFLSKSPNYGSYSCLILKRHNTLNTFPYNTLLSNYSVSENPRVTVLLYRTFVKNGFLPDTYTFPPVLKACGKFLGFFEGGEVHGVSIKMGFVDDVYIRNSLVHFYGLCGDYKNACKVFDEMSVRDVVSWIGVMSSFLRVGLCEEALCMFLKMDVEGNLGSYVCGLVASGRVGCLSLGQGIHGLMFKKGCLVSLEIGNAMIDMYVKCERLCEAKRVFCELEEKDKVTWNSMISGLVQCNKSHEAIELFTLMRTCSSGVKPDEHVFTSVLSACADLGDVEYGRWVHEYVVRAGVEWDMHIGTAVVDMYAKCGYVETALEIFDGIRSKNVYTWNALLNGLAIHGYGHESLIRFEEMVKLGFKPNEVTFLAVLNACCHTGLVDEGRSYFHKMKTREFNLSPKLEHYGCLIDLLCRAGVLDEALEIVKSMPFKPDVLICGAILSACKSKEILIELPKEILDGFLDMEFEDCGVYVLLSNIFAANRRWDDVAKIRRLMKAKGISKVPGASSNYVIKQ